MNKKCRHVLGNYFPSPKKFWARERQAMREVTFLPVMGPPVRLVEVLRTLVSLVLHFITLLFKGYTIAKL